MRFDPVEAVVAVLLRASCEETANWKLYSKTSHVEFG